MQQHRIVLQDSLVPDDQAVAIPASLSLATVTQVY